ncbi:MAG: hypothetical protein IPH35_12835 [Rhodoferax sp.]|nr:hypothetical protein [Rhodoferax sp.]
MSFKADVMQVLGADAFRKGLGALRQTDVGHISTRHPRDITGSADVDASLATALPNAARWDYVVGRIQGNVLHTHWIEVHPANAGKNVHEVEKKLAWLTAWLQDKPLAAYPRDVVWIASGKSAFNARSPSIKALAAKGCRFVGGHLHL